ncbi:hypothetical protein [uncultured Clostridium sp.]|uniref:hypothetical protein n=1 Tax=uncultured Clostridium sp. TaxID=59620 RepID=UPI00260977E6|nr:hypothetical protein [uncultured Clostridium sp.]
MALNNNHKYNKNSYRQAGKDFSIDKSKELVREIIDSIKSDLKVYVEYEPENNLRLCKAPAVKLPDGSLAIAPDIYCETLSGEVFWIEVKDKPQRVFFPDTGADLHQVLGWYNINKQLNQPVFIIFKDPALDECLPKYEIDSKVKERFQKRWSLFNGEIYGGWLSTLIELDNVKEYPCIFTERSRDLVMNIMYFNICKMKKLDNIVSSIAEIPRNISQLQVYLREEDKSKRLLAKMEEIKELSL